MTSVASTVRAALIEAGLLTLPAPTPEAMSRALEVWRQVRRSACDYTLGAPMSVSIRALPAA